MYVYCQRKCYVCYMGNLDKTSFYSQMFIFIICIFQAHILLMQKYYFEIIFVTLQKIAVGNMFNNLTSLSCRYYCKLRLNFSHCSNLKIFTK